MKLIAWYSVFLGFSVIFLWSFILKPSAQQEGSIEMGFHLMSEFLMATLCIVSGILILLKNGKSYLINAAAHGMVVYSVANAAGYYGERGNWQMALLFLVLFCISLIIVGIYMRGKFVKPENI